MVTVFIYGLDQFVVGDLSKEMTSLIAKNYKISKDEINFIAPNVQTFHDGVEQTSWNVYVKVEAPIKFKKDEEITSKIIIELAKGVAIHISVVFTYFEESSSYSFINDSYPRYMEETETNEYSDNYESIEMEEGEGEDQIYTGDIFSEFAKNHKKN